MGIKNVDTAIILAGGKSVRMGKDKVRLEVGDETLIDRAVRALAPHFSQLIVATNDRTLEVKGATAVFDEVPHLGPMGGILAGLRATQGSHAFARAVDMPILTENFLELLGEHFEPHFDAVICESERGLEPLSAVYSKSVLEHFIEATRGRRTSLVKLLEELNIKKIPYQVLLDRGVSMKNFFNVNRPEDLALAEELIISGGAS